MSDHDINTPREVSPPVATHEAAAEAAAPLEHSQSRQHHLHPPALDSPSIRHASSWTSSYTGSNLTTEHVFGTREKLPPARTLTSSASWSPGDVQLCLPRRIPRHVEERELALGQTMSSLLDSPTFMVSPQPPSVENSPFALYALAQSRLQVTLPTALTDGVEAKKMADAHAAAEREDEEEATSSAAHAPDKINDLVAHTGENAPRATRGYRQRSTEEKCRTQRVQPPTPPSRSSSREPLHRHHRDYDDEHDDASRTPNHLETHLHEQRECSGMWSWICGCLQCFCKPPTEAGLLYYLEDELPTSSTDDEESIPDVERRSTRFFGLWHEAPTSLEVLLHVARLSAVAALFMLVGWIWAYAVATSPTSTLAAAEQEQTQHEEAHWIGVACLTVQMMLSFWWALRGVRVEVDAQRRIRTRPSAGMVYLWLSIASWFLCRVWLFALRVIEMRPLGSAWGWKEWAQEAMKLFLLIYISCFGLAMLALRREVMQSKRQRLVEFGIIPPSMAPAADPLWTCQPHRQLARRLGDILISVQVCGVVLVLTSMGAAPNLWGGSQHTLTGLGLSALLLLPLVCDPYPQRGQHTRDFESATCLQRLWVYAHAAGMLMPVVWLTVSVGWGDASTSATSATTDGANTSSMDSDVSDPMTWWDIFTMDGRWWLFGWVLLLLLVRGREYGWRVWTLMRSSTFLSSSKNEQHESVPASASTSVSSVHEPLLQSSVREGGLPTAMGTTGEYVESPKPACAKGREGPRGITPLRGPRQHHRDDEREQLFQQMNYLFFRR